MKKIKNWIKYNLQFLNVINSPFRRLKLTWYFGEIKHGTPYFLPRRWVKDKNKPGYLKAVPIKYFGFQLTPLGWKTKFEYYRYEWSPMLSIVIFGKQLCIWFVPDIESSRVDLYWEAWLTYYYETKGTKLERLKQLLDITGFVWVSNTERTDHFFEIVRPYYLDKLNYGETHTHKMKRTE